MTIKHLLYAACLSSALSLVSCVDEVGGVWDADAPIAFSAKSGWKAGRDAGSRAIDPSLLTTPPTTPAPAWLYVTAQMLDGTDADPAAFLVKPDDSRKPDPDDPAGYTDLHGFYLLEDGVWTEQNKFAFSRGDAKNMQFHAYYYCEDGAPGAEPADDAAITRLTSAPVAISGCDQMATSETSTYPASSGGNELRDHILFELKHLTAMLRLSFAVEEHYSQIRSIVLRSGSIDGTLLTCCQDEELPEGSSQLGMLLTGTQQVFACAFVNPAEVHATDLMTISCTYDIYDKDDISDGHCTRQGVVATNRVRLSASPISIASLQTGYYYDLNVTIDPDYLYVLSEHDNKQHLTIQ